MKLDVLLSVAAAVTATMTLLTLLVYLLFPRCKEFIWSVLQNDTTRYDKLRMDSILRNPESAAVQVRLILAKELAIVESNNKRLESQADSIGFLQAAITQQGVEIKQLPVIAEAIKASARAVEEVAKTVHEIHKEVQDHGKRLERWDGYMEGRQEWDGVDRRGHGRRRGDAF